MFGCLAGSQLTRFKLSQLKRKCIASPMTKPSIEVAKWTPPAK